MKILLKPVLAVVAVMTMFISLNTSAALKSPAKIISVGNGVTEIIYALGAGNQVVAVDKTSIYPAEVKALPQLGYHKSLSAEGILSYASDILIGTDDMGPEETLQQLKSAGLDIASYPSSNTVEAMKERVDGIAKLLGREDEGKKLWQSIEADLARARLASEEKKPVSVVFMLVMSGRDASVSGRGTAADALIALAGGENPAKEHFSGYKPLSNEALMAFKPDVILFSDQGGSMTQEQLLSAQPLLKQTPAGKQGRIFAVNGSMLLGGFSPRIGGLALELANKFYPG